MEQRKKTVALSSVFASLLLTLLKLVVGLLTGSIGILSEAAHSALDFTAAFITYMAVRISGQPADITHHYGHGKAESVSALVETGLLLLTSAWIISESIQRLIGKSIDIEVTWYAFAVMGLSIVVDFSRSKALSKVAKETKSQALEADALHFTSDIYSSAVVIIGLIFVKFGILGGDAVAALGVAFFVIFTSYRLGKRTIDVLMDKAPVGLTEQLTKTISKINGVVEVKRVRVRPSGHTFFIDTVVTVSRKASLELVHKTTKTIEEDIQKIIPDADVVIHAKPVAIEGETVIDRVHTIASNHNVPVHDVSVYTLQNKKYINFDIEVNSSLSLDKAHEVATRLENAIKEELGSDTNVITHLEPINPLTPNAKEISQKEVERIHKVINRVKSQIPQLKEIHDVVINRVENKICISLHGIFDKNISLEDAHNLSNTMQYMIKKLLPNAEKVIVHAEPKD